jgi:hypothetical protein
MSDTFGYTLVLILRLLDLTLDIAGWVAEMQGIARWVTDSDEIIEVPPDPKPLPPAAQRALAEADERRRLRGRDFQAASGTVQAS